MALGKIVVHRHLHRGRDDVPVVDVPQPDAPHGDRGLRGLERIEPRVVASRVDARRLVVRPHADGDRRERLGLGILLQHRDGGGGEADDAVERLARPDRLEDAHVDLVQEALRLQGAHVLTDPGVAELRSEPGGSFVTHLREDEKVVPQAEARDRRPEAPRRGVVLRQCVHERGDEVLRVFVHVLVCGPRQGELVRPVECQLGRRRRSCRRLVGVGAVGSGLP